MMPPRIARLVGACLIMATGTSPAPAELSDKIRTEITASFPKYEPRPAGETSSSPENPPPPLSNDPLVELPSFHIREKKVPGNDPDSWLSRRELNRKAMSDYSDSMTDLEWALNCWYIPLVTASPQARANARYSGKKLKDEQQRLTRIAETIARIDSPEARKLLRDLDLSRHPGK